MLQPGPITLEPVSYIPEANLCDSVGALRKTAKHGDRTPGTERRSVGGVGTGAAPSAACG